MKKIFVLMLSAVLIASSVPAQSYAATDTAVDTAVIAKDDPTGSAVEPTDENLKSAIVAVKDLITVPEEYSKFNYYFSNTNSYADSYWILTWTNPNNYSSIQVNCDMNNHITSYNKYDSNDQSTGIAKYLKSELKSKSDDFIKKVAPEVSGSLEFVKADYQGIYNNTYSYYYQRSNNGVAFPDNNVSVEVNSVTGEVTSIFINWLYDVSVPVATAKLTKEEATAIIKKNMKMKLVYRTDYYSYYRNDNMPRKAFLVYEPTENYISVDANTGEVYKTGTEWIQDGEAKNTSATMAFGASDSAKEDSRALTEEEVTKIEELKNLISKSEAIKKITGNESLYLDKNLSSFTATLEKREYGNSDSTYVWNIELTDPREIKENDKDTYRAYAYACVDAKSGKVLSFYSSLKSNYDDANQKWKTVKIAYNKEQGRTVLEKFLKGQVKNYFSNSVLSEQNDDYIAYYKDKNDPVYGGYSYQYNRVNEGVEYPYNNLYGSVDGVTGKIYSYGYQWESNVTFESTKGVISADEAMKCYLINDGYGLKYEINTINKLDSSSSSEKVEKYSETTDALKVNYEIRLVYRPDVTPSSISPFTGKQLNSNGEVYTEEKPYSYKDVETNDKNRNILLLADMNIGFEGENFLPEKNITFGELKQILSKVGYDSSADTSKADDVITREKMAQIFISRLGLDKMSKLSGIYKTGYYDESSIDSEYLGAVALAKGLGIMGGDANNYFNPKSNITRFEAVNLIMNYISAQRNGIYD